MADPAVALLRRDPIQDRSAQRIELILDTTAALIDELGLSAVSASLVARRAGMSGPAIYRYFSDIDVIIRALARRNLERFLASTEQLLLDGSLEWQDAIAQSVELFSLMYREEPGFAAVQFGSGPTARFSETETNLEVAARATIGHFQPRYEAWDRPGMLHAIELILHLNVALVARAYDGDNAEFFIAEAKRLSVQYLTEFLLTVPGIPPTT